MWQACFMGRSGGTCETGTTAEVPWNKGMDYCEQLTLADYDDWRLPDRSEMIAVTDYSRFNPSLDTTVFPGLAMWQSHTGWSSSSARYDSNNSWTLQSADGGVVDYTQKVDTGPTVRCVRDGL
jgi:hypothetical protein